MIGIFATRIFDGLALRDGGTVLIDGATIRGIAADLAAATTRLPDDAILAPGFIDLQVNGGGGVMFNDATDRDTLVRMSSAHARAGTTSIFPTLISGSRSAIAAAILAVRKSADVSGVAGLHVEGPFIAPARRGIHPERAILALTPGDIELLTQDIGGPLMVTLAPDVVTDSDIAALARRGVIAFAGHSDASFERTRAALAAGVAGFTHLFNAMSPFAPRAPGVVGAALADTSARAGIIVDLHHVHPAAIEIAYAALGPSRLFLVSDAMATAGSDVDTFELYGTPIRLVDGRLTDAAGTLAGAHLTMAAAVRNAVAAANIPLADALRMATATPAAAAGLQDRGRIAPGLRADLVALDGALDVISVWQSGVPI
ncbi:MAG TPA: N-acetylglucosamine-6-phosphate deacetylase [Acetobacteraceae bacterium]|nr:N-acetylglucosamine-6-phosphate deacetylase [Acetobacteraceae bacterium]